MDPKTKVGIPQDPAAMDSMIGLASLGQTVIALFIVVGIILALGWCLRKVTQGGHGSRQLLKVVSSTPVGPKERVTIVEVDGTWLVLGVTPSSVTKLHEQPAVIQPVETSQASTSFAERLSKALNITR